MNCLEVVKGKGHSLWGYSPDTIVILQETETNPDECEALFFYLENIYG